MFGAGVGKEGEGGGGSVSEVDPSEWLAALAMCLQTALTSADVGRCVFAPVASKGYYDIVYKAGTAGNGATAETAFKNNLLEIKMRTFFFYA